MWSTGGRQRTNWKERIMRGGRTRRAKPRKTVAVTLRLASGSTITFERDLTDSQAKFKNADLSVLWPLVISPCGHLLAILVSETGGEVNSGGRGRSETKKRVKPSMYPWMEAP